MGVFLKKSVKFGPVKFNFSKNGIGTSVGVKGLRLGVNPKGKGYVSGGSNGLYFRNSLSSVNQNYFISDEEHANNIQTIKYFFYGILIFSSLLLPPLFLFTIPFFMYKGFQMIREKKISNFKKESVQKMELFFSNQEYTKIIELINEISVKIKSQEEKFSFILQIYPKIVLNILNDKIINQEEEIIFRRVLSLIPIEVVKEINIVILNEVIKSVASDNKITSEEVELVEKCLDILKLDEMRDETQHILEDYKKLEQIEISGLIPIAPSLLINDKSVFYYENNCTVNKVSTKKGIRYIVFDYSGKILISQNNIHIVGEGHKQVKISSIISIELVEKNIEITVNNRKTPYYISVGDPISFIATTKKLL